jgi:hypothetical protein
MFDLKLQIFFLFVARVVSASYHGGWSTTECSTTRPASQWSTCTPSEITIIETKTILQTAPPVTHTETSIVKSGTVLNTTQTATSSALKPRDYKGWGSNWGFKTAESWTGWESCSPSTLTKTLTTYINSIVAPSTTIKTLFETQPGMLSPMLPRSCQYPILTILYSFHSLLQRRVQARCHSNKIDISDKRHPRHRPSHRRHTPGTPNARGFDMGIPRRNIVSF